MSRNEALPTFTTGRISAALEIPIPTFQGWQRQGVFDLLDSQPTTMGRGRRFTIRDIYMIAIIRKLGVFGVRPHFAAMAAKRAVDAVDEFNEATDQVQTLELSYSGEHPAPYVRIYGPETATPLPADAIITIIINLLLLFAETKARFAATEPAPVAARIAEFV